MSKVREFLDAKTIEAPGCKAKVSDLWSSFYRWLPPGERLVWGRRRFGRELRDAGVLLGTAAANHQFAANTHLPTSRYTLHAGKLLLQPILDDVHEPVAC